MKFYKRSELTDRTIYVSMERPGDAMSNEYDNDVFFAQYAQMDRSKGGLVAAGDWHQFQPLFPPLEGMAVLDLGCGYGWHCKYAADHRAAQVLGIDLSEKMLAQAEQRNRDGKIQYRHCGIEVYEYPERAWDIVVSDLALQHCGPVAGVSECLADTETRRHLLVQY